MIVEVENHVVLPSGVRPRRRDFPIGLDHDLAGTSADQVLGFTYNSASQILTRSSANPAYVSNTAYNVNRAYSVNGLNQYTAAGAVTFAYDANGNLVSDGTTSFVYDSENRLVSASGARTASLAYDPGASSPGLRRMMICPAWWPGCAETIRTLFL